MLIPPSPPVAHDLERYLAGRDDGDSVACGRFRYEPLEGDQVLVDNPIERTVRTAERYDECGVASRLALHGTQNRFAVEDNFDDRAYVLELTRVERRRLARSRERRRDARGERSRKPIGKPHFRDRLGDLLGRRVVRNRWARRDRADIAWRDVRDDERELERRCGAERQASAFDCRETFADRVDRADRQVRAHERFVERGKLAGREPLVERPFEKRRATAAQEKDGERVSRAVGEEIERGAPRPETPRVRDRMAASHPRGPFDGGRARLVRDGYAAA